MTYASEIQTEQRREMATNAVGEVYDPPQARVGREQLTLAGQMIDYMNTVRADSFSDVDAKAKAIKAIEGLDLPDSVVNRIVTLPGASWEKVASEIPVVLERAMREEIRENTLANERRKVAARVRLDLADEDAAIVSEVVQDLLVPNSFYNPERTEQRRREARDAVEPVPQTFERSEIILRAGDIVTPSMWKPSRRWACSSARGHGLSSALRLVSCSCSAWFSCIICGGWSRRCGFAEARSCSSSP